MTVFRHNAPIHAAAADSVTVSEWIGEACRKRLPVSVRRELSRRPGAHRPKKPDCDESR